MHTTQVLDNHIYKMCQDIHKVRWNALMSTVSALIQDTVRYTEQRKGRGTNLTRELRTQE